MACIQSISGHQEECTACPGGLKRAWIANWIPTQNVTRDDDTCAISAVTLPTDYHFYEYEFYKNSSSITSVPNRTDSGNVYFDNTFHLELRCLSCETTCEFTKLATGQFTVIVQDKNDNYWYLGFNQYVEMTGGDGAVSGQSFDDFNGYSMDFSSQDPLPFLCIPASVAEPILGITEPEA